MSELKPDVPGKDALPSASDFAMHFRAKDETLTEVLIKEAGCDADKTQLTSENLNSVENEGHKEDISADSDLKKDKPKTTVEPSDSHSPNPSEYKKMFKNLNNFTEKLTKTVEGKISEIRSDLSSNRSWSQNSKDNSSISDSEENSEGSRFSEIRNISDDSPRTSLSWDPANNNIRNVTTKFDPLDSENGLRQRKRLWLPEITKFSEEGSTYRVLTFNDNVEIEPAVEADEQTKVDELDDSQYFDASGDAASTGRGGEPPGEDNLDKFGRFFNDPENKKLAGYAFFLIFCIFAAPLPSFIRGFLTCLLLIIIWYISGELTKGVFSRHPNLPNTPFEIPDYSVLPPLKVPKIVQESGVWFNEYPEPYDPDYYSIAETVPVYMEIECSLLKLSRPKGNIKKRATCDEKNYKLEFVNRRVYDLRYCHVVLKPDGLLRKRYFSKKYPIVIELHPGSFVSAVRYGDSSLVAENVDIESTIPSSETYGKQSQYGKTYLNLFARCNRQKEEWFRRLKTASQVNDNVNNSNNSTPFENVSFSPELPEYGEYWQYMTKFVGDVSYDTTVLRRYIHDRTKLIIGKSHRRRKGWYLSASMGILLGMSECAEYVKQKKQKGRNYVPEKEEIEIVRSALEIQWFNALINRFLFDVFRTPFWLKKIQAKIQRKLASQRLPYYVDALEVIDIDFGKEGPRFHRISAPLLDERGLWFDLDMTFEGSFRMTLQTQLNLIKLQKGLEEESTLPDDKKLNVVQESEKEVNPGTEQLIPSNHVSEELLMEIAEVVLSDDEITDHEGTLHSEYGDSESSESDEDEDNEEEYDDAPNEEIVNKPESIEPRRPKRKSSKKVFRVMERVAQSKYFKSIAETKYIQKAIAGVSATKIRLLLEIRGCTGTIVVNVPPPPNDRIWYGFRSVPKIWMSAQPIFGERKIRFYHIQHFVEKKILEEIKKVIVLPNMDDLLLPIPPDESAADSAVKSS